MLKKNSATSIILKLHLSSTAYVFVETDWLSLFHFLLPFLFSKDSWTLNISIPLCRPLECADDLSLIFERTRLMGRRIRIGGQNHLRPQRTGEDTFATMCVSNKLSQSSEAILIPYPEASTISIGIHFLVYSAIPLESVLLNLIRVARS